MNQKGRIGCGCLLFILVIVLIIIGAGIHPFTLRMIGNQFIYQDKIFPAEALFVPRFYEDKNGELYLDAFREYWAGNGKTIWVEDDHIFGMSTADLVRKMAKARGIKDETIKKVSMEKGEHESVKAIQEQFSRAGIKRIIILVPEYASRRYHIMFGSPKTAKDAVYLIKPVSVSYYKRDKWWKDTLSRDLLLKEFYTIVPYYAGSFKYGR